MQWNRVVEAGRKVVEAGVEKALMAANAAEQAGRRAAHSYNRVAERAPFPLPRIPLGGNGHAEEVSTPPAPPARAAQPAGPVVSTASLLDKAAAKKVTAPAAQAPQADKAPAKTAPVAKAPTTAPAAKSATRKLPTFNTMTKKMRKVELQALCRELGIPVTGEETANELADEVMKIATKG